MSSQPVIAIIGRPNVGKSTLFNRLTGTRSALVSDMPGLTRDRREEQADIGGHPVRLVDTAGLEEAKRGSIAERMRQQSEAALMAADLVLFVIDSRDGITPDDKSFARVVRNSGRPVILVANKCEGRAGEDGFYAAFELGFGEPVAISAEHGEGLGDLMVEMLSALGLKEDRENAAEPLPATERPIRVAIVGRPNAGKSTLVNAILGEERMITGPEPGLTRDSVPSDVEWHGRRVRLFDTAGLRRKAKITETAEKLSASDAIRAIRFAEVVVLLVDAERPFEHQDLTIGDRIAEEGRALVVAVNKWDLVEDKQQALKALRETLNDRLAQVPGVTLVTLSALSGKGVERLSAAVLEAYDTWNRRVSTADLNRWLEEALARHSPPAVSGRRIKIRYITQPSTRPPTFVAFCTRPEEMPKSYLRYLTNSLRQAFKLPGVPVRLNLRKGENPYAKHKR
ncbi:ribosome biogenesis GTPase Der [Hyphomicrobium sulfonivorans]|uniref:ribosome biogenesis GTPase Der n=1 Tax=Hyphomicrobium sulfonivorans TaxID=121290 RepID=UPI00156F1079|nr:ribosome biogenesis GTPase Der [Hyphomicrobium sulfonivorans]MBI1649020.1 ribosome biogenesis GTPase Der [Hyphomicrobium sulfonivorans]NSL70445.1 ribosome biogenesis GTPase Der [Hyphomicrobium sulfonivorans]